MGPWVSDPRVRNSIVSVFISDTAGRRATSTTVKMTCHHFSKSFRRLRHDSCVIGVQHTPHCPSHACQRHFFSAHIEVYQRFYDVFVLIEAYKNNAYHSSHKTRLNSNSDSTQPCRRPCATSNHSECSPSSVRTQARMPSWNSRITVSIMAGTPKRVRTYLPQQVSVDRVVRFLQVNEARV